MRNLALFLLVVLALLLVLKFFPSDDVQGAEGESPPLVERPDPLIDRPDGAAPAGAESADHSGAQSGADTSDAVASGAEQTGRAAAAVLEDPAPQASSDANAQGAPADSAGVVEWDPRREVGLAGALLHGTRGELESAVASLGSALPAGRAALLRAFHRALAGDLEHARSLAQNVDADATTDEERRLLELALGGRGSVPQPASFTTRRGGPVARAMAIGLREREAAEALEDRRYQEAAAGFSDVIKATLDAPWRAEREDLRRWSSALHDAQARYRWNPAAPWPSEEIEVQPGDSLVRIRLRYVDAHPDAVMCTGLIKKANHLRSSTIHPGDTLRIPTAEVTALVDLGARWVLYMHDGEVVYAWECAIGREGEETITGDFTVGEKIPEPPWTRVGHPVIPYGDPRNPLGTRWITWVQDGRKTSFGFHGTKEPDSIGTAASDGCIRMHNESVELLFDLLPQGATFQVRE